MGSSDRPAGLRVHAGRSLLRPAGVLVALGASMMLIKGVLLVVTGNDRSLVPWFGLFCGLGLTVAAVALSRSATGLRRLSVVAGCFGIVGTCASVVAVWFLATGTIPETADAPVAVAGSYVVLTIGSLACLVLLSAVISTNHSLPGRWRWLPLVVVVVQFPIFIVAGAIGDSVGSEHTTDGLGLALTGAVWVLLGYSLMIGAASHQSPAHANRSRRPRPDPARPMSSAIVKPGVEAGSRWLRWTVRSFTTVIGVSLTAGIAAATVGGPLTDLGSGAGGLFGIPTILTTAIALFLAIPAGVIASRGARRSPGWLKAAVVIAGGAWIVAVGYFVVAHAVDPCINGWWDSASRIGDQPLCERFGPELNWHTRFHLLAHAAPAALLSAAYSWAIRRWAIVEPAPAVSTSPRPVAAHSPTPDERADRPRSGSAP